MQVYALLVPNKYILLTVILLSVFVVIAGFTSYRTYTSDIATATLSTRITNITHASGPTFYATGYSAFALDFFVEVWNSYNGVQKLESPTNCGFEIMLISANINATVDMFQFGGICSEVPTTFRYESGITKSITMSYLRVFSEQLAQIPEGLYVFAYKTNYATNKTKQIYETTLSVAANGSFSIFTESVPDSWGAIIATTTAASFPTFPILLALLIISKKMSVNSIS